MILYLPDTNVWISWLQNRSPAVVYRLRREMSRDTVRFCSVVKAELLHGEILGKKPSPNAGLLIKAFELNMSLAFDDACARTYAELRLDLEAAGNRIGNMDMLIAATALAYDLTMVTHNTKEYARVPGLRVEDWQTDVP